MTSHSLSNSGSGSKQNFISFDTSEMAVVTVTALLYFFRDELKSINKSARI